MMNSPLAFNRNDVRLMRQAVDAMRDHQHYYTKGIMQHMKDTPEKVWHEVWKGGTLDNQVREWDRQMTYWALLCRIADKLDKIESLMESDWELRAQKKGDADA